MKLAAAVAAAFLAGLTALAEAPAQAPATPVPGCAGIQLADKAGDNEQPTTDIVDVWFTTEGEKTAGHLRVSDMNLEFPTAVTAYYWNVTYLVGEDLFRLTAKVRFDGAQSFSFQKRTVVGPAATYESAGEVTATIFEGKDGVIRWELPPEGAAAGTVFKDFAAAADEVIAGSPPETGYLRNTGAIDDTVDVPSTPYTVQECATAPPEPEPAPAPASTPAPPQPQPAPPPAQQQAPPPQGTSSARTDAPLAISVERRLPPARAVKRILTLRLASRQEVSFLEGTLFRGTSRTAVARGALSTLEGPAKLRMRVRVRGTLRPGRYTLFLAGRNEDGAAASRTLTLRLR